MSYKAIFFNNRNKNISNVNPALIINVEIGSTVRIENNLESFEKIAENGVVIFTLPSLGEWKIYASKGIKNKEDLIIARECKAYEINIIYPKIMTAIIDQNNSNPATCVTYTDDAASMTRGSAEWDKFFGYYPCLFKDGKEVGRLNPNNFAQFEDGTPADITSGSAGDVMIAFPRRGLTLETIDNKIYVKMTEDPDNSNFGYLGHTRGTERKEIFYVAAFEGSVKDSKLRSLSNVNPSVSISLTDFRNYAHANGEGYELWTFYQWTFLQAMYVLKYANLDSQSVIGYGRGDNSVQITGSTIDKGMNYGNSSNTSMKLFGIENFYGNVWNCIDGCITFDNGEIGLATDNFNDNGNEYNIYNISLPAGTIDKYISSVEGTTELGFIPKSTNGDLHLYFSDSTWLSTPLRILYTGSSAGAQFRCGVFCFDANDVASAIYASVNARCSWY